MTIEMFAKAFNTRAEQIGHELRVESVIPGEKAGVLKLNDRVSIICGENYAQVISRYDATSVADNLTAYCTCLDVLTGATPGTRNGWLKRLHLFDGGVADGKPKRTEARGWVLELLPHNPSQCLYSMVVKRA